MTEYDQYFDQLDRILLARLQATSNTFLRRPQPRPDFINARRSDGCVPCITAVPA